MLAISYARRGDGGSQVWRWPRRSSSTCRLTWPPASGMSRTPPDWKQTRNRWEFFQGLRSWLLLIGFTLVCVGAAME